MQALPSEPYAGHVLQCGPGSRALEAGSYEAFTLLMCAATSGNVEATRLLLAAGDLLHAPCAMCIGECIPDSQHVHARAAGARKVTPCIASSEFCFVIMFSTLHP